MYVLPHLYSQLLDIVDMEAGTQVAGARGYYLKREGVLLNQVWGWACGCVCVYETECGVRQSVGSGPVLTPIHPFVMHCGV